jgi:hypothetical protein
VDWAPVLTGALTAVVTGVVMAFFMRAASKPPESEGDAIQLRYPKVLRVFSTLAG